jgi:Fe-S oxidoreductase
VQFSSFVRGVRSLAPPEWRSPCPHGEVLQEAARWSTDLETPERDLSWVGDGLKVASEGDTALFVGCLPLFDALFGEDFEVRPTTIARSAITLLNHLGIEPVLLSEERCCGHDLLWSGDHDSFDRLANANIKAFQKAGIRHILTACAECARTWRLDYPEVGSDYQPKVQHLAEFLAEHTEELSFADADGTVVTYQDPCRLGRHLEVFDSPRDLLEATGARVVEMERSRADAQCCGTAGFVNCDQASRQLQAERLSSAQATGADRLITACPKCWLHFTCARCEDQWQGRPRSGIEVEDLTVLAARLLENEAPGSVLSEGQEKGGAG